MEKSFDVPITILKIWMAGHVEAIVNWKYLEVDPELEKYFNPSPVIDCQGCNKVVTKFSQLCYNHLTTLAMD